MPKISPPITVQALKALKLAGKPAEIADGGCPGLRIRVGAGGTMTWSLLATDNDGRRKRIEIGAWPETGIPTARALAGEFRGAIKRERAALDPQLTFAGVIDLYGEKVGREKASWSEANERMRSVFRPLLERKAATITRSDLLLAVDKHKAKSSASAAVRYLRPLLRWAAPRNYMAHGLWEDLRPPLGLVRRRRVLDETELGMLLNTLGYTGHDGAARMMLLTGCRREEVCGMRFEDIVTEKGDDGRWQEVWTIPSELRKNGKSLRVPLSWAAVDVVGRQGRVEGLVFLSPRGARLSNWERWQRTAFARTGTQGWHRHDLRRTAATYLGEAGIAPHVIEAALGHTEVHSSLAGTYNLSRYEGEHAEALKRLADIMSGIQLRWRGKVEG